MHDDAAKRLIEETFNQPYSHDRFKGFIRNLTKGYEERSGGIVPDSFKDGIKSVYRIGKYVDATENEIDILAVTLSRETSLDRARTLQRNFVARWLNSENRPKDAALVAFVSPESSSWRFSLVRRELSIALNRRGKSSVKADFSPVRRFSFLVGVGERTHTVKRQLIKFLTTDDKPTLKTLEEAFNIETVTDEFFKEYRELFNRVNDVVVACLDKNLALKQHFIEKDIEASDFAKRLLGQIVFLYFLQKKGWLGVQRNGKWGEGSRAFLRDLYNRAEKEGSNFFDKYLRHLFYEALNRDHSDNGHYHSLFDSRIPFLNGGLFEPYHDYEWSRHDIALPNVVFHELGSSLFGDDGKGILDVFDRYNFTVAEDEPLEREVAIDPEMLGKVFENLLEVKDRKAKGTYYTPREIVHYMCQESLIAHLATRFSDIPKADIEDVIRYGDLYLEYDTEILKRQDEDRLTRDYNQCQTPASIRDNAADLDQALATIKVCDPAIGSGAFPVGMMTEIIRVRRVLALHMRKKPVAYELKRQTIQDCLYGVDLDPGAIEIAKLRLWLSLVVDEDNFDQIQSLPNLDYKIMQGNSLLQTYERVKLFDDSLLQRHDHNVRRKQQLEGEMRDLQARLMAMLTKSVRVADPKEKKALEKAIGQKQKEIDALSDTVTTSKTAAPLLAELASASGIAEQLRKLHVDFFRTAQTNEKKRLKAEIENLETHLVEASLRELHQNKAAPLVDKIRKFQRKNVKPYFLWKLHFSEVFSGDNGGFDIVIANPPYVRADIDEQHTKMRQDVIDSGQYDTLWEKWDTFVAFIELGYKLLKPDGVTTMIVSDAFCHSKYAQKAQNWYLKNARILRLDFCSDLKFFDAAVHNLIYFFQCSDGARYLPERRIHSQRFGNITWLETEEQAKLTYRAFFPQNGPRQAFSCKTVRLNDLCYVSKGMVVHADEKVAHGSFRMEDVVSEDTDDVHPKKFAEGKHLGAWLPSTYKWLEWGTRRAPSLFSRPTFPELHEVKEKILVQRSPGPDPKCCYDNQQIYFTESSVGFVPWHFLKDVRNRSLQKVARYTDEKPLRSDLPRRDELEKASRRFDIRYLLAIMNSLAARTFLRANRRSNIHLYPDDWKQLPIPDVDREAQAIIIRLVDNILAAKQLNRNADVSAMERAVNTEVYKLYGLISDEISAVEEAVQ